MGCSASRINPIDRRLAAALIAVKQRRGLHKFKFDELLLKFNKLARGFKKCRESFALLDTNGDQVIDIHEFTSQAGKLGLDLVSVQELTNIFEAADIDNSACIDVFEFVLVFVILHLLHPERSAHLAPEIRTALEIVEDAFCCFDASSDGLLEKEEVEQALCSKSAPAGRGSRALSERLFRSLDFDGNGNISFKEFLIGLEKMVMEEYEEDDDVAEEVSRSFHSRASIDRLRSMPRSSNVSSSGYLDAGLNPNGGSGVNPNVRTGSGPGPHGSGTPSVRSSLDMHNGTSSSPSVRGSLDAHRPCGHESAGAAGAAGAAAGVAAMGIAGRSPAGEASAMAAAGAAAWGPIAGSGPGALPRTGSAEARHSSGGAHAHHTNNHVRMDDTPVIVDKALSPSSHNTHASGGGGIAHAHSGGAHELVAAAGGGLERGVSGDKVIRSALRNAVDVDAYTGVPADMQPEFL